MITNMMRISFDEENETLVSARFEDINSNFAILSSFTGNPAPIGTLLVKLVETDFSNHKEFSSFINHVGYSGLHTFFTEQGIKLPFEKPIPKSEAENLKAKIFKDAQGYLEGLKKDFTQLLYFCFDLDAKYLNELNAGLRHHVLTIKLAREGSNLLDKYKDLSVNIDLNTYYDELFNAPYKPIEFPSNEPSNSIMEHRWLENIVEQCKTHKVIAQASYGSEDLSAICFTAFKEMVERNTPLRKCKNCNKFFVVTRRIDTQYCSRQADGQSKTCEEIGSKQVFQNKVKGNPVLEAFEREYKRRNAHIRLKKTTPEIFSAWSTEAREMRDKVLNNEIPQETFLEWLKI